MIYFWCQLAKKHFQINNQGFLKGQSTQKSYFTYRQSLADTFGISSKWDFAVKISLP